MPFRHNDVPELAKSPDKVTVEEAARVVKAPVEAVVAPIAVELIPVAVVLKLEDVMVRALAPVEIDEADSPDKVRAPEVAVKLSAPVVWVKPLEAVKRPADVIVPDPEVEIFPDVETVPSSVIVNLETPPD